MKYIPFFLLLILFTSCLVKKPYTTQNGYIFIQNDERSEKEWKLVWKDDFNAAELDTQKWTKIPPNGADWGKHMSNNPDCYSFKNGCVYLTGVVNRDTLSDSRPFLTGGIYTKGKFAFQYGKIEICARLENARGSWPAMWMLSEQKKYGDYPRNGEIDIMEHLNFETKIYQTTHSYYTLELGHTDDPPHGSTAEIDTAAFNVYGLAWYPDELEFMVNGKTTFTYPRVADADASQWPYDQPFYVLIDQQLGGNWVGRIEKADLPVSMIVDWVKVYQ
ncbi:glycoside hydrolase family 16 protein [Maribellus sp. YY47]|uniref:glycoside hydrolase family 16 protein n=1 Tax=Maribellus sp. YY47 TaxID=2929486 RepID=UPI002001077F|nr:glycoside hydrolase family 16 protein [Maribellus sp. YY47]MCK3685056.1 glycoside hydrolase family 16 protein [Maribellus sp. YY47]